MTIQKLTALTAEHLQQMYALELVCGLEPYSPEMLVDCVENLDTFACLEGERILGFLTVGCSPRYLGGSLYIVNLNVDADYRRRGIATELLYHIGEFYRAFPENYPIMLDVERTNPARHLYEKLGFLQTSIPSENGLTDIVMAATLGCLQSRKGDVK